MENLKQEIAELDDFIIESVSPDVYADWRCLVRHIAERDAKIREGVEAGFGLVTSHHGPLADCPICTQWPDKIKKMKEALALLGGGDE